MTDIQKGRIDRPRDEGIIVPRIERERKEKEGYRQLPADSEKRILSATFFSYLEKLFHAFSGDRQLTGRIIDRMAIVDNLRSFQQLISKLKSEDFSQSPKFASDLSESWHQILEDYDTVLIMERKELKKSSGFRQFVDAIKHYPKGADHPLGYYLMEQAGKDWLPFPFIDLLRALYKEHKEKPSSSTLINWDRLIEEVIESLKGMRLFDSNP